MTAKIDNIKNESVKKILQEVVDKANSNTTIEDCYNSISNIIEVSLNICNYELLLVSIQETVRSKIYKDNGKIRKSVGIKQSHIELLYKTLLEAVIFYVISYETANKNNRQYAEDQGDYLKRMIAEDVKYIESALTNMKIKKDYIN